MIPQAHDTWKILDSSKLNQLMSCPRSYFFRYILGWTPDRPNIHLSFGEAWHRAMEVLFREGYTNDAILRGLQAFNESYSKALEHGAFDIVSPKASADIASALAAYVVHWRNDDFPGTPRVKWTEVAGTVLISDDRLLHFRLDAVVESPSGKMDVYEHKTASRFDNTWSNQWSLSFQIFAYLHVLHSLFEPEAVGGIIVNGAAFLKTETQFMRVPVRKGVDMLNAWLYEANHWVDLLEMYTSQMMEQNLSDEVMSTFPKNTSNCTKYGGCPFQGLCNSWSNPLQRCDTPPPGYKIDRWNPANYEERPAKVEINIKGEEVKVKNVSNNPPSA